MATTNPTRYLRRKDLCERYRISGVTLWRWVKDHKIPEPIYLHGRPAWPEHVIDEHDAAHTQSYEEHRAQGDAA